MKFFRRREVLDLRDAATQPRFGQPIACPTCGGMGRLDRIDVRNDVQYQSCVRCGAAYATTKAEFGNLINPKISTDN